MYTRKVEFISFVDCLRMRVTLLEWASRRWMHECMGINDYFPLWSTWVRWCAGSRGTLSIFGLLVPTNTSSFPSPHNQLPLHASVDLTGFVLLLSSFDLTTTTCGRTNCFLFIDWTKVAKLTSHLSLINQLTDNLYIFWLHNANERVKRDTYLWC